MKSDDESAHRRASGALPPLTSEDELPALAPEEERALWGALVSAYRPEAPEHEVHAALVEAALVDPLAPATPEELSQATALRDALDRGGTGADIELARDLTAAFRPPTAGAGKSASLRAVARALPPGKAVRIAFATSAALALAAGIALLFYPATSEQRAAHFDFAESRSLSPLFARDLQAAAAGRSEGSDRPGTSERLDRIVAVRSRELRDNRFATWGVQ